MFKHILATNDGSALADRAIAQALKLANACSGKATRITALMVVPDYTMLEYADVTFRNGPRIEQLRESLAAEARRRLEEILDRHGAPENVERSVAVGDAPYDEILKTAEELQCDLIVMAARGRSALKSALLGSQTSHVLSQSRVPVLVIK